jgi:tetratricopeptide (TPR) repeat protein
MAWRKIAVLLGNDDRNRDRSLAAIETAYRHRERLTEYERLLTEGYYYTRGPRPNADRALAAYEEVIRLDSNSTSGLNNAAVIYGDKRDYERAEELYRRVVRLPRTFGGAFTNLIQEQIRNGRLEALDSTVAAFRARFPESYDLWEAEWYAAWGKGRTDVADSISRAVFARARTTRQSLRAAFATGLLAYLHGRRDEGLRWTTHRSEATVRASPSAASRITFALDTAYDAAIRGNRATGLGALAHGLARYPLDSMPTGDRPWEELSQLGADLEEPDLARKALAGFERDQMATTRDPAGRQALYAAHLALAERRWEQAIRLFHEADKRVSVHPRYAMVRIGQAHHQGGRADSATVYFERFLATRDPQPEHDARWRAEVHRSLGELYEAKGAKRDAADQYRRFVNLWAGADQALQPRVAEARHRLKQLGATVP